MRQLLSRVGRAELLLVTALLWFMGKFLRYSFPPLFEPLQATYGVSNAEVGFAFTGFMIVYAAMQLPSGVLADRLGSVKVITGGGLLAGAAALALVVESPFLVLVGVMLFMGAGTGVHKTVAVRLLSRTYPSRTGGALGVLDTFGAFGGVVAPAAVVVFVGLAGPGGQGWRTLFLLAGLVGVSLSVWFVLRAPRWVPDDELDPRDGDGSGDEESSGDEDGSGDGDDLPGLRSYLALFRDPRFSAFVVVTILFSFTYNGVVAFLPLYLIGEAGLASSTAGLLYSALFLASLVQLVTGDAGDRIGQLPVITLTLGLAAAALGALLVLTPTGDPLLLGAAAIAIGLGSHGFRPVRGAYLMSVVPTSIAGGGLGIVRTLLMGAGAISPAIVGVLSETVGFRPAFSLLAASVAGATALASVLLVLDYGNRGA